MVRRHEEIRQKLARYMTEHYIDITAKVDSMLAYMSESLEPEVHSGGADPYSDKGIGVEDARESVPCPPCRQDKKMEPPAKGRGLTIPAFLRRKPDRAEEAQAGMPCAPMPQARTVNEIDDFLKESFEEEGIAKRLNLYMYERDITTAMIYERCFVDRRLISKITSGTNYHPSKNTMLALCIGLRLNLQEGEEFLLLAGYSFSNTSKYDLIMKFMLQNEIYDLDIINEMLYLYEQPCLGA